MDTKLHKKHLKSNTAAFCFFLRRRKEQKGRARFMSRRQDDSAMAHAEMMIAVPIPSLLQGQLNIIDGWRLG